jgi:hypothetical protein
LSSYIFRQRRSRRNPQPFQGGVIRWSIVVGLPAGCARVVTSSHDRRPPPATIDES